MFASKTPSDLNHDRLPYEGISGGRGMAPYVDQGVRARYTPRPEFDHVQHNEPNPFLSAFRLDVQLQSPVLSTARCAQLWLKHDIFTRIDPAAKKAHVDHARVVLARLAGLEQKGCTP